METIAQVLNRSSMARKNRISKVKNILLGIMILLLPSVFWQPDFVGSYTIKITLLASVLVLLAVAFFISVLSDRSFSLPKSKIYIPLALFVVGVLLASVFSGAPSQSFLGVVFDLGTSGSLIILAGAFAVASIIVKKENTVRMSVFAFLASQLVTLVYLIVRAASIHANFSFASKLNILPAGGMSNTAILMGVAVIMSVCLSAVPHIPRRTSFFLWLITILGTALVGASGFTPAIILLGLFSVVYFVYLISWNMGGREPSQTAPEEKKISVPSIFVLVASVVFIVSNGAVTSFLSDTIKVSSLEIRPNAQATFSLISEAWKENPFLGVGPDRFGEFWSKNKPAEVNMSDFWAADFSFGYSLIPTLAITTGIVGLLPLLFFFAMFVLKGFKTVFLPSNNENNRFVFMAIFFSSLYLWLITFVYVPDITVLGLMFIFSGLCVAAWTFRGIEPAVKVELFSNPKTNFISVLSIVTFLVLFVSAGYFVWERAVAARLFGEGAYLVNANEITAGQAKMVEALNLVQTDVYWRGVSEAALMKFNAVLERESGNSQLSEQSQNELQAIIGEAVESAKQAVALDPESYVNWGALANTYEILATKGVAGSLENAKAAYMEALDRSPRNPAAHLALGRVEAMSGNLDAARASISKAIELKNNYTDAHFTLAQIEAASNNLPGAIKAVEDATVTDTSNAGLFFQLGMLKYGIKDFVGAEAAFKRAIAIVPDYANAKYFLGLTYNSLGENEAAINEFEEIKVSNPDNAEIDLILNNLKNGRNPFYGAQPPVTQKPEKRVEPPIEE